MNTSNGPRQEAGQRDGGNHAGSPATADSPATAGCGSFEDRLLAELKAVVAERAATGPHPASGQPARRSRPARPLLLTGAASAALAAGVTAALVVVPGGTAGPAFAPAATAAAVLNNAALAALAEPVITPRPDQFVYSKLIVTEKGWPGPEVDQTWLSAGGTRIGRQSVTQPGGRQRTTTTSWEPACRHGHRIPQPPPKWRKVLRSETPCTPADFAAYLPGLPTRPAALRAWLDRRNHFAPGRAGAIDLLWTAGHMLTTGYLTPAQHAALYRVLARAPGLTVVPGAANLFGRPGVGVRWTLHTGPDKGSSYTLVFDRKTYRLLGMNWTGRLGLNGASGGEVLVRLAIVSKAGALPG